MNQLKRVDYVGTVLFIGSTTSVLIPITWGGVSYAWSSWRTLVPLFIGVCGEIAFVAWEYFFAKEPLIRLRLFSNRTSSIAFLNDTIHGMILWTLLYYLPLYYEAVKNENEIITGISVFPETFTVAPVAVATGIAITKTGRYRWAIWSGWALTCLGMGLLYLLDVHTTTVQWIFLNLVSGIGMGLLFPSMAFAVQASSLSEDQAFAVTMFSFFRSFGQAIGVAVGGTIFQNQIAKKLMAYPLLAPNAASYSSDAAALVQVIKSMVGDPAQKMQHADLIQAYADALKVVWVVMCALAAFAGLTSFWIKGLDMNAPLSTEQGFTEPKKAADPEKEEGSE